ncbi:MAG: nucleotidyltransferase family protein [Deltaproteobacteria bacterium]|nr:nucleotidyltransferase family protein [Deltaproteobacteria bacterium]
MIPQYIILFFYFDKILEEAAKNKIDIIPLKGAHLLTAVYQNEDRGVIADIDFMVREEDWKKIIQIMENLGFVKRELPYDETDKHEMGFYMEIGGGKRVLFEAHQFLFSPDRFYINHKQVWERAYHSTFDNIKCMRMSDEDIFCHIAFHSAVHRFINLKRARRDLQLILQNTSVDIAKIIERAKEWGCRRAVWIFLDMLYKHEIINTIEPPSHIKQTLRILVKPEKFTNIFFLHHRIQAAIIWPLIFDTKQQLLTMLCNRPE